MFIRMTGRLDRVVSAGGCSAGLQSVISDLSQYRFHCSVHVPLLLNAEFFNGTLVHKERERECVCVGRSPAEIVGSNPTGDMDICLL